LHDHGLEHVDSKNHGTHREGTGEVRHDGGAAALKESDSLIGPEVGIEEFRKNLIGISRNFGR
jgi:hypothetical protein